MKLGFREGLDRESVIDLVLRALYEAADEDSATGGPDLLRGIFPVVATITASGFERVGEDELRQRYVRLYQEMEGARGGTETGGVSGGPGANGGAL